MSQTASAIPPKSGIGKLQWIDVWKGFVKVAGGTITVLVFKLIGNHFKLPTYSEIQPLLEVSAGFFLSYLGINAGTNNVGQLFKADKPVMTVEKEHYEELKDKAEQADEAVG